MNALKRIPLVTLTYAALRRKAAALGSLLRYSVDLCRFRARTSAAPSFLFQWKDLYPCLGDNTPTTGFDRHYTFHTAWAARLLAQIRPAVHHDISSAIYFSTIVSAFIPVRFYDYRPSPMTLSNLTSEPADLLRLPFPSGSLASVSCMHVVEHIGLGRYGDPIDPEGPFKAIAELQRVVSPGGHLLFVVPLGAKARVQFNAHRIFTVPMVLAAFGDHFTLKQFTLIPDDPQDGDLVLSPPEVLLAKQFYACGCFWFEKKR